MSGQKIGPELSLIEASARNASARIRFFRIAFGAPVGQNVSEHETTSILREISESSRIDIAYLADGPQSRADIRMVYLAVMCLETALAYGGTIKISQAQGDWSLLGTGTRTIRDDDLWTDPNDPPALHSVAPSHVQFVLLPLVVEETGRVLRISHAANEMRITMSHG